MKRFCANLLPVLLVALIVPALLLTTTGTALAASCGSFHIVATPNLSALDFHFNAVKAISANDVWAVGEDHVSTGLDFTLAEHWNGSAWSQFNTASPGLALNRLFAVDATSPTDVWAVGSFTSGQGLSPSSTLIEHWDGSQWSVVASPSPGTGINELFGVAAISPSNAWAVGHFGALNSPQDSTLIEHWDGTQWSVVASPNASAFSNRLNSVTAISSNNVWAVGNSFTPNIPEPTQTLIEHWDGTQWSIVASANVPSSDDDLISVAAISANDIWAVGQVNKVPGSGAATTLTEHWNGSQWKVVASPNNSFSDNLVSVSAITTNNVWAAGGGINQNDTAGRTLLAHWNGRSWTLVKNPTNTALTGYNGVSTLSVGNVWAVGFSSGKIVTKTLAETNC